MTQAAQLAQYGANNVGLSFKNRIINGDMTIDQRNEGAAVTATGTFPVDRFRTFKDTASGTLTGQRSTIAPAGFVNSLSYTITSAFTPSSSEGNSFNQIIEGLNVADLGWGTASAQPVTLSFWVRASVTGTYGGSLRNNAANRSYPFSYTILAANTFEYKTITVPGETTGTWETGISAGIYLFFSLGTGSVLTGTAGAWANGNFINTTGATNITSTAGATYYITGVQLEKGTVATSYDYLPYGTELMLCQRYYQAWFPAEQELIYNESSTSSGKFWQLYMPVQMRTAPTATYSSGMVGGNVIGLPGTISSLSLASASRNRLSSRVTMSTNGGSANLIYHCDSIGSGDFVGLNSEL
jgi:hypothetical protein